MERTERLWRLEQNAHVKAPTLAQYMEMLTQEQNEQKETEEKKMEKNQSDDVGVLTVTEAIELLQSLPRKYHAWPIYCCGSDEVYLNVDAEEQCLIFDEEELLF